MDNTDKMFFKDFWTFAIISTLMIVFFPWSLLVSVIFYGLDTTQIGNSGNSKRLTENFICSYISSSSCCGSDNYFNNYI